MFDMETEKRRIFVVSANRVYETGTISFMFMVKCGYPDRRTKPMPQNYGWIWTDRSDGGHPINVFEGGKGLIMGGGWDAEIDPEDYEPEERAEKVARDKEWRKSMIDAIPSCTLLMDKQTFEWWKKMCSEFQVEFEHYHFDGDLETS